MASTEITAAMPEDHPDKMPVDISFVFEKEKPAGKHGFVYADGDDLRFADGTLAKFWGVNFNGGACFPDKDYAPKVAQRLAQAGCNIVRFHQLDAEWDTPNIFSFSKGKRVTTTRVLDPKSMDHLDYLIACLKEEGIYIYLDMLTSRKFKEADGLIIGSPVYYASPAGTLVSFLDRLFFASKFDKTMKVGASVAVARRGGTTATFDVLNKYFTISL